MSFAFTPGQDVEEGVRQLAGREISKALAATEDDGADIAVLVHGLRRRCKKVRGLLRLVRPVMKGYKLENRAFRQAARQLGNVRDAGAMVETFDALLEHDRALGAPVIGDMGHGVRVTLVERAAEVQANRAELLGDFRKAMAAAEKRARHWQIGKRGFASLQGGLEASYAGMRDDYKLARRSGKAADLHEWRKDTKHHWYHTRLLVPFAPSVLGARAEQIDQLGRWLGDHQNLAVLNAFLAQPDTGLAEQAIERVRSAVGARQAELEQQALALGRELVAERPEALAKRYRAYWTLGERS